MNWVDSCVLVAYLAGITLFGIWAGYRRNASSEQYFLAGKSLGWFTIGAAVFTSKIFEAINKIPMTFAPAVTTVFLFGIWWKRGTAQAAMATLYAGSCAGIVYFIADLPRVGQALLGGRAHAGFAGLITDPVQGAGIPFMLVGPLIAVFCIAVYLAVSLSTPAMDLERVAAVCWDHPFAFLRGRVSGAGDPRVVALILFAVVAILYWNLR